MSPAHIQIITRVPVFLSALLSASTLLSATLWILAITQQRRWLRIPLFGISVALSIGVIHPALLMGIHSCYHISLSLLGHALTHVARPTFSFAQQNRALSAAILVATVMGVNYQQRADKKNHPTNQNPDSSRGLHN